MNWMNWTEWINTWKQMIDTKETDKLQTTEFFENSKNIQGYTHSLETFGFLHSLSVFLILQISQKTVFFWLLQISKKPRVFQNSKIPKIFGEIDRIFVFFCQKNKKKTKKKQYSRTPAKVKMPKFKKPRENQKKQKN